VVMPRNIRNFWLEASIDGRVTSLDGGPQAKDGGFTLAIFQRRNGSIVHPVSIDGWADSDGKLHLSICVRRPDGAFAHIEVETKR